MSDKPVTLPRLATEPDERDGYEWNVHLVEADRPHMRICFMSNGPHSEAYANLLVSAANERPSLQAQLATARSALEKAASWLEGWASAEPYLSEIRSTLSTLAQEPAGQSAARREEIALLIFNARLDRRGDEPITMAAVRLAKERGHDVLALDLPVADDILALFPAHPTVKVSGDAAEMLPEDMQLLWQLHRDNTADGTRPVIESQGWEQAMRLSDAGYIAIEQLATGGCLHITRKGIRALPLTPEGRS